MKATRSNHVHPLMSVLATAILVTTSAVWSSAYGDINSKNDLRSYFQCDECDISQCPAVSSECQLHPVLELGVCGCCKVCPLAEGDSCGIYTRPCAEGLRCSPPKSSRFTAGGIESQGRRRLNDDGVRSLFYGDGRCLTSAESNGNGKYGSAGEKNQQPLRRIRF